jgi:hypothetical protein
MPLLSLLLLLGGAFVTMIGAHKYRPLTGAYFLTWPAITIGCGVVLCLAGVILTPLEREPFIGAIAILALTIWVAHELAHMPPAAKRSSRRRD